MGEYLRKKEDIDLEHTMEDDPHKEPLYSSPDRPVYDSEGDLSAEAYPGTGYKMDQATGSASRIYLSKRPAPESFLAIKGIY